MNTCIVHVAAATHETGGLEALHDPRHRRRADLLGGGKLPERTRAAEDEHGKRGELRRRDAGGRILAANVPEGMDRRRVKAVGGVD
jgi:hypothetical protein